MGDGADMALDQSISEMEWFEEHPDEAEEVGYFNDYPPTRSFNRTKQTTMNKEKPIEAEVVKETALAVVQNPVPAVAEKPPVTAAQAKVEAIADLTHSAYQKAATLQLTKEETDRLLEDFPDEAFKTGAGGKADLLYIEHAFLRDRFLKVFGIGQWAIIPRRTWSESFKTFKGTDGERVYVEAMLVVRGCFMAEAVGSMEYYPKNENQNYGDAVEGAKTAAFRRCAKECGVGLQAWKKDWCAGWFERQRNPAPRPTPRAATPVAKPKETEPLKQATEAYLKAMIKNLKAEEGSPNRKLVQEYFFKTSQLLPTEPLEKLPLCYVPRTKEEMEALINCVANFEAGGEAVRAFDTEGSPAAPAPNPEPVKPAATGTEWRDIVVPIPRKGMKRDEYLQNPDTIVSLYDERHQNEDARKRLWGLKKGAEEVNWIPQPREFKGKVYQPSEADKKFYQALRTFDAWFKQNHPDEKL